MKPKNEDFILNVLKEKYRSSESINFNAEGKYDFNQKFIGFSFYDENKNCLK